MNDSAVTFTIMAIWVIVAAICVAAADGGRRIPAAIMFVVVSAVFGLMAFDFMAQERDRWFAFAVAGGVVAAVAAVVWMFCLFAPSGTHRTEPEQTGGAASATSASAQYGFVAAKPKSPVKPAWGRRRFAARAPASRYAGYRRAAPRGG